MTEPPVNREQLAASLAALVSPTEQTAEQMFKLGAAAMAAVELIDKMILQTVEEFVRAHEENAPHFYRDGSSS